MRRNTGDERLYWVHRWRISANHEVESSGSENNLFLAIVLRMLSGSRVIIPNSPSCLIWRDAVAPGDLAMKSTKHSGVFL